jgi:hypothetical protein
MSILTPKRLNNINKNNPYRKKFLDIRNEFRRKKNKNKKKFNKTVNYFKEAKKILLASFQNHKLFYGGGQGQSGDREQQDELTKIMAYASLNPESQIKLFEKTGRYWEPSYLSTIEKKTNELYIPAITFFFGFNLDLATYLSSKIDEPEIQTAQKNIIPNIDSLLSNLQSSFLLSISNDAETTKYTFLTILFRIFNVLKGKKFLNVKKINKKLIDVLITSGDITPTGPGGGESKSSTINKTVDLKMQKIPQYKYILFLIPILVYSYQYLVDLYGNDFISGKNLKQVLKHHEEQIARFSDSLIDGEFISNADIDILTSTQYSEDKQQEHYIENPFKPSSRFKINSSLRNNQVKKSRFAYQKIIQAKQQAQRQQQASQVIQRMERGRRAREQAQGLREQKTQREQQASENIQRIVRGRRAREQAQGLREEKREQQASENIQRIVRGRRAREQAQGLREQKRQQELASQVIQRMERGRRARQQVQREQQASENIQRIIRARQARQQTQGLRERKRLEKTLQDLRSSEKSQVIERIFRSIRDERGQADNFVVFLLNSDISLPGGYEQFKQALLERPVRPGERETIYNALKNDSTKDMARISAIDFLSTFYDNLTLESISILRVILVLYKFYRVYKRSRQWGVLGFSFKNFGNFLKGYGKQTFLHPLNSLKYLGLSNIKKNEDRDNFLRKSDDYRVPLKLPSNLKTKWEINSNGNAMLHFASIGDGIDLPFVHHLSFDKELSNYSVFGMLTAEHLMKHGELSSLIQGYNLRLSTSSNGSFPCTRSLFGCLDIKAAEIPPEIRDALIADEKSRTRNNKSVIEDQNIDCLIGPFNILDSDGIYRFTKKVGTRGYFFNRAKKELEKSRKIRNKDTTKYSKLVSKKKKKQLSGADKKSLKEINARILAEKRSRHNERQLKIQKRIANLRKQIDNVTTPGGGGGESKAGSSKTAGGEIKTSQKMQDEIAELEQESKRNELNFNSTPEMSLCNEISDGTSCGGGGDSKSAITAEGSGGGGGESKATVGDTASRGDYSRIIKSQKDLGFIIEEMAILITLCQTLLLSKKMNSRLCISENLDLIKTDIYRAHIIGNYDSLNALLQGNIIGEIKSDKNKFFCAAQHLLGLDICKADRDEREFSTSYKPLYVAIPSREHDFSEKVNNINDDFKRTMTGENVFKKTALAIFSRYFSNGNELESRIENYSRGDNNDKRTLFFLVIHLLYNIIKINFLNSCPRLSDNYFDELAKTQDNIAVSIDIIIKYFKTPDLSVPSSFLSRIKKINAEQIIKLFRLYALKELNESGGLGEIGRKLARFDEFIEQIGLKESDKQKYKKELARVTDYKIPVLEQELEFRMRVSCFFVPRLKTREPDAAAVASGDSKRDGSSKRHDDEDIDEDIDEGKDVDEDSDDTEDYSSVVGDDPGYNSDTCIQEVPAPQVPSSPKKTNDKLWVLTDDKIVNFVKSLQVLPNWLGGKDENPYLQGYFNNKRPNKRLDVETLPRSSRKRDARFDDDGNLKKKGVVERAILTKAIKPEPLPPATDEAGNYVNEIKQPTRIAGKINNNYFAETVRWCNIPRSDEEGEIKEGAGAGASKSLLKVRRKKAKALMSASASPGDISVTSQNPGGTGAGGEGGGGESKTGYTSFASLGGGRKSKSLKKRKKKNNKKRKNKSQKNNCWSLTDIKLKKLIG